MRTLVLAFVVGSVFVPAACSSALNGNGDSGGAGGATGYGGSHDAATSGSGGAATCTDTDTASCGAGQICGSVIYNNGAGAGLCVPETTDCQDCACLVKVLRDEYDRQIGDAGTGGASFPPCMCVDGQGHVTDTAPVARIACFWA